MSIRLRPLVALCVSLSAFDPSAATAADAPAIGHYGFDEAGMDRSVRPGDDFDRYANGTWLAHTTIPGDHPYWGNWDILADAARAQERKILEEAAANTKAAAGTNVRRMGDYYASYMDEAQIERLGAQPLKSELAAIASVRDYTALARAMGRALRVGDDMPLGLTVFTDLKHPDVNLGYVEQGGLGLPDREYYLSDDASMVKAREAYLVYATKLLRLSGVATSDADARARAQGVYDLEHRLAEVHWTRVAMRNIPARYDVWQTADYATKAPGLDWNAFLTEAGLASQQVLVASTNTAIVGTAALVPKVPLATWRDYLVVRIVDGHAQFLSRDFVDAHFAYHSTALSGTPDQLPRWQRGARYTEKAMGEAIGEVYVARHFSPQAKASALALVRNLLAATARRIDASDWMSPQTKARAREKVASFDLKIGYPDRWRDYSKLAVARGDAYGNALAADRFEYERGLAKLGKPVDRSEWQMTPMTVNAYYNPTRNEIVFPAAVLQPPFFDPLADTAVNYGGIGAIIGHEISHGFDDQGRQFDATGAMTDWWTPADAEKYKQRADALVSQYSAYEALPGLKVNGELTLGENIADTAGLVVAYDAYHASLGSAVPPRIDGTTGDERFFLAFAQNWRTLWREQLLRQVITTDPHAPDAIRVRTVRNFDPWYAAFGVLPADHLYLAPDARVRIW